MNSTENNQFVEIIALFQELSEGFDRIEALASERPRLEQGIINSRLDMLTL